MSAVAVVLERCNLTEEQLAECECTYLEKVRLECGRVIVDLMKHVGQKPVQIGDEKYEPAEDKIEQLLKIMETAEKLCRIKKSKAFGAFSLPGAGSCGDPVVSSTSLRAQYVACCGGS